MHPNTPTSKVRIGLIGCGKISAAYITGSRAYEILDVAACADLDVDLARRTAREHGLAFGGSVEELLADPGIEIVVNLTIPAAHQAVNRAILAAGKHVYCEKPLALSSVETAEVLADAASRRLRIGSAPDTFLGSGLQTARRLIDEGAIGRPVAAMGFMLCPGHESWHPNPDFYYKAGGGPMFDMGPYYITALVNLLGPVARVSGVARTTFPERTITSQPRHGQTIAVETPTHYSTTLEFGTGAVATLVMSFDTHRFPLPNIVVFGSEGNLRVPDPNHFDGIAQLGRRGAREAEDYVDIDTTHATGRARGSGVADLAHALRSGRSHRANGELAHHVVEVMEAAMRSSEEQRHIGINSTCGRPAAVPSALPASRFDQ